MCLIGSGCLVVPLMDLKAMYHDVSDSVQSEVLTYVLDWFWLHKTVMTRLGSHGNMMSMIRGNLSDTCCSFYCAEKVNTRI